QAEHAEMSSQDASWKGNKSAHHRQHATNKESPVAIAVYPFVGQVQVLLLKQKPAPILLQERSAAIKSEKIRGNGANQTTNGASQGSQVNVHLVLLDEYAGCWHDCFAGKRNIS